MLIDVKRNVSDLTYNRYWQTMPPVILKDGRETDIHDQLCPVDFRFSNTRYVDLMYKAVRSFETAFPVIL